MDGEGMMDTAKDAAGDVADKAGDATDAATDKVGDAADTATDKIPGQTDDKVVDEGKSLMDRVKGLFGK
jgi:hypothetical protein